MRPALVLLVVAVACRASERDDTAWVMHPDRVGAMRFGMSATQARQAMGDTTPAAAATECIYWRPPTAPPGVSFMIENGIAVRADVDSAGVQTPEGIGVGSTEAAIRDAYGNYLTVQLHKYQWEAGWRYFKYLPPTDSLHAIVFETDGKAVRRYHAGQRPQVEYVERCG
jgi:hypothetical protein